MTGQFASVDEDLSGRENLMLLARLLGLSGTQARARCAELLVAFDLEGAAARQLRSYSGGMRRRLDIAASLITQPELLFLDEPTTGLDPRARANVWAIVRRLAKSGTTVLLTTQYLEEADQLAECVAVIDNGKVIAEGSVAELKARLGSGVLRLTLRNGAEAGRASGTAARLGIQAHVQDDPRLLEVPLTDAASALPLLSALVAEKTSPVDFAFGQPSLDAVFLALTGHGAEPTQQARP